VSRPPPTNTNYTIAVKAIGYPNTALICGRGENQHDQLGWVYLLPEEYEEYQGGKRIFSLWGPDSSSSAAKARVSDETVNRLNRCTQDENESDSGLQSQSSISHY
jgi:hypothetical protein